MQPVPGSKLKIWLPAIRAGSGSDVFVERLAEALNARGMEATIRWFPHWLEIFPDLLRGVKPPDGTDIIHVNAAQAFAFKRDGIPLVATELHYVLDRGFRPFKSRMQHLYHRMLIGKYLHRSFSAADAVTAISEFTAGVLRNSGRVKNVQTIPLWVDLDTFAPRGPRQMSDEAFRLLFVGNASRRKGADVIPLLAARLGLGFEIVCTAGLRQQMHDEMPANVRILGRLDLAELVRQYQECDVVLVPSRYEGFGYAALEGMACAKPIVGFRSEADAEVVGSEGTELLADIDDIIALEHLCRMLARNRWKCMELGGQGRRRAENVFSQERAISAYIDLYEKLIRGQPGSSD